MFAFNSIAINYLTKSNYNIIIRDCTFTELLGIHFRNTSPVQITLPSSLLEKILRLYLEEYTSYTKGYFN